MTIQRRPITIKFEIALTSRKIGEELIQTVNLRDLHTRLENGDKFADWIKSRIEKYDFIENKDFILVSANSETKKSGRGGDRRSVEYFGILNMAKELAMVENNTIGKCARQYFIQCEEDYRKQQQRQNHMPRGYPQMLQMAREDWKATRNELIQVIGTYLSVYDRKRKSQFTDQMYLQLIETRAQQLRAHFELHRPQELTRDYLHQLVQEAVCEVEIRMSDAIISGTVTDWQSFNEVLNVLLSHTRVMKEIQNGRTPLPRFAFPQVHALMTGRGFESHSPHH